MSDESEIATGMPVSSNEEANPTLEEQLAEMEGEQSQQGEEGSPIPEKFRGAEDPVAAMAEAYAQLEKKLGAPKQEDPPEMRLEKIEGSQDLTAEYLSQLGEEYMENGDLTEESYQALAKRGITKDVVDMFVNAQMQQAESNRSQILSEAGIDNAAWETMSDWAARNWSEDQVDEWNDLANSPNPLARKLAVENLKQAYTAQGRGQAVTRVEGTPVSGALTGYRSQAEMLEAMKDPRFDKDPAYREDVERRVEMMLRAQQ